MRDERQKQLGQMPRWCCERRMRLGRLKAMAITLHWEKLKFVNLKTFEQVEQEFPPLVLSRRYIFGWFFKAYRTVFWSVPLASRWVKHRWRTLCPADWIGDGGLGSTRPVSLASPPWLDAPALPKLTLAMKTLAANGIVIKPQKRASGRDL